MTADSYERAPDFPAGRRWFQVDPPPSLQHELAGNVVLVHFMTTSFVHALKVLPTLRFLEQRFFRMPFAVVSVVSPKYDAERDPGHVAEFLHHHGIRHPVMLDDDRSFWTAYACRAWPTVVLIDPDGRIRSKGAGDPDRQRLMTAIEALLDQASTTGSLGVAVGRKDLPLPDRTQLARPTSLTHVQASDTLWITDGGNNRILSVSASTGAVLSVAGTGAPGAGDAAFAEATFAMPRGIAVLGSRVFVADTGNHLVRCLSLLDHEVTTVVGQGRPVPDREGGGRGIDQGLCVPAGLTFVDGRLYLAMAGTNQLWSLDIDTGEASAFAGYGREAEQDGGSAEACFATPTAIAASGEGLAIADAEGNTIRLVDRTTRQVTTLAGGAPFRFGWRDGIGTDARFQHPMDLVWHDGVLLVADTYNDAIRRVTRAGEVTTLVPPGAGLRRPEGLCIVAGRLLVADTGNNRLVAVDLSSGALEPFPLRFEPAVERSPLPPIHLRSRSAVRFRLAPPVPFLGRLHPDAPAEVRLTNLEGDVLTGEITVSALSFTDDFLVEDVPTADPCTGRITIVMHYLTCHDLDAVCHLHRFDVEMDVEVSPEGLHEVFLRIDP